MNVAFFCSKLTLVKDKNISDIDSGNPGMGGTEYLFLLVTRYLKKVFEIEEDLNVFLLTQAELPAIESLISVVTVKDIDAGLKWCVDRQIDYLVLQQRDIMKVGEAQLAASELNFIIWAHNVVARKLQKMVAAYPSIKRLVCVSQTQYENMADSICFPKCCYINNGLPQGFFCQSSRSDLGEKSVVYIGALVPQKGLHNLLSIWRRVVRKVPDANLYVIGGSKVWDPGAETGSMNLAHPHYEKKIRYYLGKMTKPESVHFLGVKSCTEINEIIKHTRVGVVNPSQYRRDETFCMSAVEICAHGIPVISRKRNDGLNSTVKHGETGYLEAFDRIIAKRICDLLNHKEKASELGNEAFQFARKFTIEESAANWKILFESLEHDKPIENKPNKFKGILPSRDSWRILYDKTLKRYHKLF